MTFSAKLKEAGRSRTQLASELGISRSATTKWGEDCPRYASVYLDLLIEVQDLRKKLLDCETAVRVMTQTTKGTS